MTDILWIAVGLQMAMGGLDTLYHHELTQRLAWRPGQASELRLHGVRNLAYAVMFAALGWCEVHGPWAWLLIALMGGEFLITLWDFVEEDRSRKLPASERVLHTLLTLNYGVILALVAPVLLGWADLPASVMPTYHGIWSWFCTIAAVGVIVSGLRDLAAAARLRRVVEAPAAPLAAALGARKAILVTGGTGFVGRRLVSALVGAGHEVTVLTRDRASAAVLPAPIRIVTDLRQITSEARIDAIVNLAGEPIADTPWTGAKRRRILRSRLRATRAVLALIERLYRRPEVLVSGSAVGWYGLRGDDMLDEGGNAAACFSHEICRRWEDAAGRAEGFGVRTVLLRTGLVLAVEGGVLSRMLTPFEFGLGGPFGDGAQWMSWIHRDDLVRLIIHAIADQGLSGAVNATAPEPVSSRAFADALGRALGRPAALAMPAAPLRLALGDFAEELLLSGQRVVPRAALARGFRFNHPAIGDALAGIVGAKGGRSAAAKGAVWWT